MYYSESKVSLNQHQQVLWDVLKIDKKNETPLDYMGPEESVLNLMQAQQTRAKTERDHPQSPEEAGQIAFRSDVYSVVPLPKLAQPCNIDSKK